MNSLKNIIFFSIVCYIAVVRSDCNKVIFENAPSTSFNGEWDIENGLINNKEYYAKINGDSTYYLFFMSACDGLFFNRWIMADSLFNSNDSNICECDEAVCSAQTGSYYSQCIKDVNVDKLEVDCKEEWQFPSRGRWVTYTNAAASCLNANESETQTSTSTAIPSTSTSIPSTSTSIPSTSTSIPSTSTSIISTTTSPNCNFITFENSPNTFINGEWVEDVSNGLINNKKYYIKIYQDTTYYLFFMTGCDGRFFNQWIIADSLFNSIDSNICQCVGKLCSAQTGDYYSECDKDIDSDQLKDSCNGQWAYPDNENWVINQNVIISSQSNEVC